MSKGKYSDNLVACGKNGEILGGEKKWTRIISRGNEKVHTHTHTHNDYRENEDGLHH